jgi:hypothetical protein
MRMTFVSLSKSEVSAKNEFLHDRILYIFVVD